jgi:putative FmdB family regulatory protein
MPLYEYRCDECGSIFTLLQTIHIQPGETECETCRSHKVTRIFSSFHAAGDELPFPKPTDKSWI